MKKIYFTSLGALLALSVSAQDKTGFVNTTEDITIYNIMQENAPQNPNIKDVSRFTLVGKDSKFYLGYLPV